MFKGTLFFLFSFLLFSNLQAQHFKESVVNKKWILASERIENADSIVFVPYNKEKISLNTMIWVFKPNGRIEYDYQSSDDIEACAGVDFLDLEIESCSWRQNTQTFDVMLTLKGGYASIDDFLMKNEYVFSLNEVGGFTLGLKKKFFFKDYTLTNSKP